VFLGHQYTPEVLDFCSIVSLVVTDQLNVLRSDNGKVVDDVWAIGDACVLNTGRLPATAQGS
jgi:hypothetical protein